MTINLSPVNYFFASPSVLYVADSGVPKNTSAEQQLQRYGQYRGRRTAKVGQRQRDLDLKYTLYQGLNLVEREYRLNFYLLRQYRRHLRFYGLTGGRQRRCLALRYKLHAARSRSDYLYGITDTVWPPPSPEFPHSSSSMRLRRTPTSKACRLRRRCPPAAWKDHSRPPASPSRRRHRLRARHLHHAGDADLEGRNACTLSVASPQGNWHAIALSQRQDGTTATTDYVTAPVTSAVYSATFLNLPIVTLSPSLVSTNYGGGVLLTATVTWGGNPVTSGTVTFHNGSTLLGFGAVNSSGVATLSTTTLPVGLDNLTASYAAQGQYSGATSSAVTESVVQPPSISLTTTAALSTVTNGYQATVTIKNTGNATANNVQITLAALGSATASVPVNIGSIAGNGGSAQVVLNFPSSAGSPGAGVAEKYSGTYTGGSFSASIRATLP